MKKEYVLKLHLHEVTLIVDALEGERERASKMIAKDGKEQDTLDFVKQAIDGILHKIDKRMVCIN
jgi:hypothetical protein